MNKGDSVQEMRFSVSPPPLPSSHDNNCNDEPLTNLNPSGVDPSDPSSDFNQWLHAMKMVARLPGGMPPEFRRKLWLALSDKYLKSENVNWVKEQEKCFSEQWREDDEELGIQIVKDLHRTGSSLCSGPAGTINQAKLKRILLGYARYNPEVGYCQGFNMLGALILQVMDKDEVESIKVMIFLVEGILPTGYFSGSLGGLQADMAVFREIMTIKLPKLAKHLQRLQGPVENAYEPPLTNVFTMQWFLTMFCTCLPMSCVLRVWDLVLIEGSDVLLRTALAIWSLLEERILNVRTADDFYCKMGSLSGELLNGHLIDSNGLIEKVVQLGPIPELQKLRDKHLYNISPWRDQNKGLKLYYSDEEPDSDDDSRLAVTTAWGLRLHRRGSLGLPTSSKPPPDTRDRIALDISLLKKQYDRLRERQRQAHIIITSAVARQTVNPPQSTSVPVNHLLMGRAPIVTNKGRRLGPPKGAIPPPRKHSVPNVKIKTTNSKQKITGETLYWRDTDIAKRRKGSLKWKDINIPSEDESKCNENPSNTSSSSERPQSNSPRTLNKRSDSSSYSEDSDANSSTSTSLCDEDDNDPTDVYSSSLESSPLRKHKTAKKGCEEPEITTLAATSITKLSNHNDDTQNLKDNPVPSIEFSSSEVSEHHIVEQKLETCEEEEDSTTESDRVLNNFNDLNELLEANKTLLGEATSNTVNYSDENTTISAYANSISKLLNKSSSNEDIRSSDFLNIPAITSTSQLSPIADISNFLSNSSISPLKTPTSYFNYSNLLIGNNEEETNTCQFDVNEDGVTNEYFERVNIVERPTHLDLLYSLNNEKSFEDAFNIIKNEASSKPKHNESPPSKALKEDLKSLKASPNETYSETVNSTDPVSNTTMTFSSTLETDIPQETTLQSTSHNSLISIIDLDCNTDTLVPEKTSLTIEKCLDQQEYEFFNDSQQITGVPQIAYSDANPKLQTEIDNRIDVTTPTVIRTSKSLLDSPKKCTSLGKGLETDDISIQTRRVIPTEIDLETRFKAVVVEKSLRSVKNIKSDKTNQNKNNLALFELSISETCEKDNKFEDDSKKCSDTSESPKKMLSPTNNFDPFFKNISFPEIERTATLKKPSYKEIKESTSSRNLSSETSTSKYNYEEKQNTSQAILDDSNKPNLTKLKSEEKDIEDILKSPIVKNKVLEKENKYTFALEKDNIADESTFTKLSTLNETSVKPEEIAFITRSPSSFDQAANVKFCKNDKDDCTKIDQAVLGIHNQISNLQTVSDHTSKSKDVSHLSLEVNNQQFETKFQNTTVSPKRIIPSAADLEERFNAVQSRSPKKVRPLSTTDIEIQSLLRDKTRYFLNSPNQPIIEEIPRSCSVTIGLPNLNVISTSSILGIKAHANDDLNSKSNFYECFELSKSPRPIPSESDLEFRFKAAELHIDKSARSTKSLSPEKSMIDLAVTKNQSSISLENNDKLLNSQTFKIIDDVDEFNLSLPSNLSNSYTATIETTISDSNTSENTKSDFSSLETEMPHRQCIMKEKSYSVEDYKIDEKFETRPTSCPEARENLNESSRTHSDRILKIIEENSQILHRILKKNTDDSNTKIALDLVEVGTCYNPNEFSEQRNDNTLSEFKYDNNLSLTDSCRDFGEIEENKDETESSNKSRPLSRISDHSNISYKSDDNIADRLASIKNTIKSIDSLCEEKGYRKEKCQRYIDSLFEPTNKDQQNNTLPPSITIIEDNSTLNDELSSLTTRTFRDFKREISPRRRRDEDREEYESRVRRDKNDFEVAVITGNDQKSSEKPISPYYANRNTYAQESDHARSSTPNLYVPAKLQIRHTTVTSTFYDRYLSQKQIEKNFKSPRSPRSPVSPISTNISKNYLDVLTIDRNSKSAENSPSRHTSTIDSNQAATTPTGQHSRNYAFNNIIAESSFHIRSCDNILLQLKSTTKDNKSTVGISSTLYNPLPTKIKKPSEIGIQLGLYKKPPDMQLPKS